MGSKPIILWFISFSMIMSVLVTQQVFENTEIRKKHLKNTLILARPIQITVATGLIKLFIRQPWFLVNLET